MHTKLWVRIYIAFVVAEPDIINQYDAVYAPSNMFSWKNNLSSSNLNSVLWDVPGFRSVGHILFHILIFDAAVILKAIASGCIWAISKNLYKFMVHEASYLASR